MLKQFGIAAALCVCGSFGAQAATYNISLTGFCNTFSLTTSTWQVYGTRSGCSYTVTDGGVATKIATVKYLATNDSNDSYNGDTGQYTWLFTKPKQGGGDFYLYYSNGSSQTEITSGTYTYTAPGIRHSGPDITAKIHQH
jgi:hypothetical protein